MRSLGTAILVFFALVALLGPLAQGHSYGHHKNGLTRPWGVVHSSNNNDPVTLRGGQTDPEHEEEEHEGEEEEEEDGEDGYEDEYDSEDEYDEYYEEEAEEL